MSDVIAPRFTCVQGTRAGHSLTAETARSLIASCEKTWRFQQPGAKAFAQEALLREFCRSLQANLHDEKSPLSHTLSAEAKQRIEQRLVSTLADLKDFPSDLDVKRARAELESLVLQAQRPAWRLTKEQEPFIAISIGNTATVSALCMSDSIAFIRDESDGDGCTPSYPATPDVIPYMPNPFTAPVSPISAAQRLLEPRNFVDNAASRDFPTLFQSADPNEQQVQATKLFARIVRRVLTTAESQGLAKVHEAILVVPCSFTWHQRDRLRRAAMLAGVANTATVTDAVASAVCHLGQEAWSGLAKQTAIVLHVGGHSIHAAVLSGRNSVLKLRALAGFRDAGGEQLTNRLVRHCCEDFFRRTGYDLLEYESGRCRQSLCRLRAACEKAKRQLSAQPTALIEVESLLYNLDYRLLLERSLFEELNTDVFNKCLTAISEASSLSRISKRAINHVIIEGGSAVIARLQEMVLAHFEGRAIHLHCTLTDESERVLQVSSAQAQAIGAIRFHRLRLTEAKPNSVQPLDADTDYATIFTYRKG